MDALIQSYINTRKIICAYMKVGSDYAASFFCALLIENTLKIKGFTDTVSCALFVVIRRRWI